MFLNKYKLYRLFNYFSVKMKRHIPDDAPTKGCGPIDDADVIRDGSGIDVVLDEVVEVEFVDLDMY